MMNITEMTTEQIFSILSEVSDPEIPVLSIVDLGIVREVEIVGSQESGVWSSETKTQNKKLKTNSDPPPTISLGANSELIITITPTYTGCPAMKVIEEDILSALKKNEFENVKIKTVLSPAWTTDWLTVQGKKKLLAYGIAPPEKTTADKNILFGKEKEIPCPLCGSLNTEMKSQFGSTACKALYVCKNCKEPFDYFKCI